MQCVFTSKDIESYGLEVDHSSQIYATIAKLNIVNEGTVKAHVLYSIDTQYPGENGKNAKVQRRYNDFEWLQRSLEQQHKDILIPPIPEKDALARFQSSVLNYRKREFNRFLARITIHPVLSKSNTVELFLTATEAELAQTQAAESTLQTVQNSFSNPLGAFNSVFQTVTKVGQQIINEVDEVDEWYSVQKEYLDGLDKGLSQAKKDSTYLNSTKTDQIGTSLAVAEKLRMLAELENERESKMAKILTVYQDFLAQKTLLDETLVKNQALMFEDSVTDQQRLSVASKTLLDNRLDVLLNYQIAQHDLSKAANLNASTEKLALEKKEAEEKEAAEKEKFDDITVKVKQQVEDYKSEKSKLMRWALRELVRENIEYGEQAISVWKELGTMIDCVSK